MGTETEIWHLIIAVCGLGMIIVGMGMKIYKHLTDEFKSFGTKIDGRLTGITDQFTRINEQISRMQIDSERRFSFLEARLPIPSRRWTDPRDEKHTEEREGQ